MKLNLVFLASASAICFSRKQCVSSALAEYKETYQVSACAIVEREDVQPRGEWSVNTVRKNMYEFQIFCADRSDCKGCSIDLDDDDFFSVHGYDAAAFTRRGRTLFVKPLPPKQP